MNPAVGLIVSVVAILIAACGVTVTAFALRRKTDEDYTGQLERQIEILKGDSIMTARELDDCRRGREDLQRQNYSLLAELHTLEMRDRRRDDG